MCIRDSHYTFYAAFTTDEEFRVVAAGKALGTIPVSQMLTTCLLYTSDAADERSSVDLGGRRIIKKKKNRNLNRRVKLK